MAMLPWLAAAASGVLLALCFPPFNQGWLAWVALTPLICAVWLGNGLLAFEVWRLKFGVSPKRGSHEELPAAEQQTSNAKRQTLNAKWFRPAALGYLAGVIFFAAVFQWLGSLGTLYGNPWLHLLPLVLALYMGLYFAFWAWFLARFAPGGSAPRNVAIGALGASAWVAHEWMRGWLFSGFGWNTLGVALHRDLPMIQIVDITGVAGLSWLVAFCNLMAVIVVRRIFADLRRARWEFTFTMALVVLVFGYGVRKLTRPDISKAASLRIAALQPNIPQTEKFDPAHEDDVFQTLAGLTGLATLSEPAPHVVLWPESSTPRGMFADSVNYEFVMSQARRGDFGLLLGTLDSDPERGEDFNVAALLTARGEQRQIYRKMHLVPFGEYLPLRPIFEPLLGQLVPADFSPGREFTLLEIKEPAVKLAALICFEDTDGELTRRFVRAGAQVLVNLTNDGWFLRSAAAEQQLANAVFRSVENRRPLVRCANTGVTCAVDRTGRVDRWLEPFQQGFAVREVTVPVGASATFFTRHGDLLSPTAAFITALALVFFSAALACAVGK